MLWSSAYYLSRGNSVPERVFSSNKNLLDAHGNNMGEDTIQAHRFIKDAIHRAGGSTNIIFTRQLIDSVKGVHAKSVAADAKKTEQREQEERANSLAVANKKQAEENTTKRERLAEIKIMTSRIQSDINVAEAAIEEGNSELGVAISSKKYSTIQAANSKITMGLVRKRSAKEDLNIWEDKKKKLDNEVNI